MSKRRSVTRKGVHGDVSGCIPKRDVKADVLLELATKAHAPVTQRARSPRNKDGQSTNYAGFGNHYFRLSSSLVRATNMMQKQGERLVYPERTLADKERAKDAQAAAAVVAGLASWLPEPGQRIRHNYKMRHSHRVEPCPNGRAPRGKALV